MKAWGRRLRSTGRDYAGTHRASPAVLLRVSSRVWSRSATSFLGLHVKADCGFHGGRVRARWQRSGSARVFAPAISSWPSTTRWSRGCDSPARNRARTTRPEIESCSASSAMVSGSTSQGFPRRSLPRPARAARSSSAPSTSGVTGCAPSSTSRAPRSGLPPSCTCRAFGVARASTRWMRARRFVVWWTAGRVAACSCFASSAPVSATAKDPRAR